MHTAIFGFDAAHNFIQLQKVVDKGALLRKNPPRQLAGGLRKGQDICVRPLLMRSIDIDLCGCLPASTERSSKGLFAFSDRTTTVMVSGPAWAASQKHRPSATRRRAERPVSEGPQEIQGRVVKTNPVSMNRCLMGALGCRVGYRHLDGDR